MTDTAPYDAAFYDAQVQGSLSSARAALGRLFRVYHPRSAVDFGCGRGAWLSAAGSLGCQRLRGFDGPWVSAEAMIDPAIEFTPVNMEAPLTIGERFEMAISVEVAEHLPPQRAPSFVADLCHSSDVVVFSAAIPHQGGTHHVNEQPQHYWVDLFRSQGYECFDVFRGALWNDQSVMWWYRQNLLLFVSGRALGAAISRDALQTLVEPLWDTVHPELLEAVRPSRHYTRLKSWMQRLRRRIPGWR